MTDKAQQLQNEAPDEIEIAVDTQSQLLINQWAQNCIKSGGTPVILIHYTDKGEVAAQHHKEFPKRHLALTLLQIGMSILQQEKDTGGLLKSVINFIKRAASKLDGDMKARPDKKLDAPGPVKLKVKKDGGGAEPFEMKIPIDINPS